MKETAYCIIGYYVILSIVLWCIGIHQNVDPIEYYHSFSHMMQNILAFGVPCTIALFGISIKLGGIGILFQIVMAILEGLA